MKALARFYSNEKASSLIATLKTLTKVKSPEELCLIYPKTLIDFQRTLHLKMLTVLTSKNTYKLVELKNDKNYIAMIDYLMNNFDQFNHIECGDFFTWYRRNLSIGHNPLQNALQTQKVLNYLKNLTSFPNKVSACSQIFFDCCNLSIKNESLITHISDLAKTSYRLRDLKVLYRSMNIYPNSFDKRILSIPYNKFNNLSDLVKHYRDYLTLHILYITLCRYQNLNEHTDFYQRLESLILSRNSLELHSTLLNLRYLNQYKNNLYPVIKQTITKAFDMTNNELSLDFMLMVTVAADDSFDAKIIEKIFLRVFEKFKSNYHEMDTSKNAYLMLTMASKKIVDHDVVKICLDVKKESTNFNLDMFKINLAHLEIYGKPLNIDMKSLRWNKKLEVLEIVDFFEVINNLNRFPLSSKAVADEMNEVYKEIVRRAVKSKIVAEYYCNHLQSFYNLYQHKEFLDLYEKCKPYKF